MRDQRGGRGRSERHDAQHHAAMRRRHAEHGERGEQRKADNGAQSGWNQFAPQRARRNRRSAARTMVPATPAMTACAAVRNSGSTVATANLVAGRVPANSTTPARPSTMPMSLPDFIMA